MKKESLIKVYIIVVVLTIIAITTIVVLTITRKKTIYNYLNEVTTYYISNTDQNLNFPLYSSKKDNEYLKTSSIDKIILKSKTSTDEYNLQLLEVVQENASIKYSDIVYYKYRLKLNIPFEINELYQINDSYISIKFVCDEVLNLNLGSIIFYKKNQSEDSDINISYLRGVTNIINTKNILCGIGLRLKLGDDITITKLLSLDQRVKLNGKKTKTINIEDYDNNTLIDEIIQEKYDITSPCDESTNLSLVKDTTNELFIPLSYKDVEMINTLAFVIEYEKDGIHFEKIILPFTYYSDSKNKYYVTKHIVNYN